MPKTRMIRILCAAIALTALSLALVLTLSMNAGLFAPPEETEFYYAPPGLYMNPEDFLGDIGSLRDWLAAAGLLSQLHPSSETVMEITASQDDTVYLKMNAYSDYNGRGWEQAEAYGELLEEQYSADYLMGMTVQDAQLARLTINPTGGLYCFPYYIIDGSDLGADGLLQTSDISAAGKGKKPYTVFYTSTDAAIGSTRLYGDALTYERSYRSYVYEQYLEIDEETAAYMKRLIEQEGFADGKDVIEAVAAYIRDSAVYNMKYDTAMDQEENVAIAFLETYKEGVCRHYATAATLLYRALGIPARYTVGFRVEVQGGETVKVPGELAHAWVEVYLPGCGWQCVEVTGAAPVEPDTGSIPGTETLPPEPGTETETDTEPPVKPVLTIRPLSETMRYDPNTPEYALLPSGLVTGLEAYEDKGYTYAATIRGRQVGPGRSFSDIETLLIFDPEGRDVTEEFVLSHNISYKQGSLQVYLAALTFVGESHTVPYNGSRQVISADSVHLTDSEEVDMAAYEILITPTGGITHVGTVPGLFTVTVLDVSGAEIVDATDCFLFKRDYGFLTVTPAPLTLKAGDATAPYEEGILLTAPFYSVVQGALATGDSIVNCTVEGSQATVGRSDNVITDVTIFNELGEDVTGNYSLLFEVGTLRVTLPGILPYSPVNTKEPPDPVDAA